MTKKIFIVEDNKKIRDELSILLSKNGYQCNTSDDMKNIISEIIDARPHLILLDINLPMYDGFYLCRQIRERSDIPIIVVTSRDSELDELTAMNIGADDYITKPFNTQILLLRISSILKRVYDKTVHDILSFENCSVVLSKSILQYENTTIELTKNELKIMNCFYEHKDRIVSRETLMVYLWNSDMFIDDNTLTVNINRLRKKLENVGLTNMIETKRGQGYLMK